MIDPPQGAARAASRGRFATKAILATTLAGALALVAVPAVQTGAGLARDAERLAAIEHIDRALQAHHEATGSLPAHVPDPLAGGWESSRDGHFLAALVATGHLTAELVDPLNDREHQLLYHRYPAGTEGSPEPFYVLAVTAFESDQAPPVLPAARGERDWSREYPLALVGP